MGLINELRDFKYRLFSNRKFLYKQYLPFRDFLSRLIHPRLFGLHRQFRVQLEQQKNDWQNEYCDGYFYQGYERVGICGVKPTEQRFRNYSINDLLNKNQSVLDIGSKCGFVSIHVAGFVKEVDGG